MQADQPDAPLLIDKLQKVPTSAYVAALLLYVVFFFASHKIQLVGLAERDGYFHARFAQMLPEVGVSAKFGWMQQSVLKDRFCDKEFLYHVLMVPFTRDVAEPIVGAQVFSVLLIAAVFLTMFMVLRKQEVPVPVLVTGLMLALSGVFVFRLDMIRSHVLSILLSLVAFHFLARQRWVIVGILGFIFSWSYSFPLVLVIHACVFSAGRWWIERKLDWKCPLMSLAGVIAGLLIHPYSPQTLDTLSVLLKIIQSGSPSDIKNLGLGSEYFPPSVETFAVSNILYIPVAIATFVAAIKLYGRKAMNPETAGAVLLAFAWLTASLRSFRLMEYAVPMMVLAVGMLLRDWHQAVDLRAVLLSTQKRAATVIGSTFVAFVLGHIGAGWLMVNWAKPEPPHFKGATQWLAANSYPRETIINLYWHDFPELYYHGPRQTFIWGIDPVYTHNYNAEVGERLQGIISGKENIDRQWMMKTLKARYLILKNFSTELDLPDFRKGDWIPVYADKTAIIFDLRRPPGPLKPAVSAQNARPASEAPTVSPLPQGDK